MNSGEINPANIEEVLFKKMIELLILHTSRQLPLTLIVFPLVPCMPNNSTIKLDLS